MSNKNNYMAEAQNARSEKSFKFWRNRKCSKKKLSWLTSRKEGCLDILKPFTFTFLCHGVILRNVVGRSRWHSQISSPVSRNTLLTLIRLVFREISRTFLQTPSTFVSKHSAPNVFTLLGSGSFNVPRRVHSPLWMSDLKQRTSLKIHTCA